MRPLDRLDSTVRFALLLGTLVLAGCVPSGFIYDLPQDRYYNSESSYYSAGTPGYYGQPYYYGQPAITRGSSTSTTITIATTAATRAIATDVTSGTSGATATGVTRLRTGRLPRARRAASLPKTRSRRLRSRQSVEGRRRARAAAWLSSSAARSTRLNAAMRDANGAEG